MIARLFAVLMAFVAASHSAFATGVDKRKNDFYRATNESAVDFAARAIGVSADTFTPFDVLETKWNGHSVIFASYVRYDKDDRPIFLLWREASRRYRKVSVTLGETEGGAPDVDGIGFANADADPAKELIVILGWHEYHEASNADSFYDVRIFDDVVTGSALLPLTKMSKHFQLGCTCDHGHNTYRYKKIASVKAELKRLGY